MARRAAPGVRADERCRTRLSRTRAAAAASARPPAGFGSPARGRRSAPVFVAVDVLARAVIGHRLFTISLFDAARFEGLPASTPACLRSTRSAGASRRRAPAGVTMCWSGCRSSLRATRRPFVPPSTIIGALFALEIGSILNIPVVCNGCCVGTMNLCHAAQWFTPQDVSNARLITAFLAAPLMDLQDQIDEA